MEIQGNLLDMYKDWQFSQFMNEKFKVGNVKERYELSAIFERMILTSLQSSLPKGAEKLSISERAVEKAISEIKESGKIQSYKAENLISDIDECFQKTFEFDKVPSVTISNGKVTCGDYVKTIPQDVMKFFTSNGATAEEIVTMLLGIERTSPGGQQWALPADFIKHIHKTFGGDILIPFASPINVARAKLAVPELKYCSINHIDTIHFGSSGPFSTQFAFDFVQNYKGEHLIIVCNPPFVEEILESAAFAVLEMIKSCPKEKKISVFFNGPGWGAWGDKPAANFVTILDGAKHLPGHRRIIMKSGSHHYDDSFKSGKDANVQFFGKSGSYLYFLSNRPIPRGIDLTKGYATQTKDYVRKPIQNRNGYGEKKYNRRNN